MSRTAQTLRVLRALRDLTQHGLAERAGLTQTRFWQIEHGSGAPLRARERNAIASVLEVKPSAIAWPVVQPTALQTERAKRQQRRERAALAALQAQHTESV
jgi:transcriptional regulator with XRE-family HTH domain